MRFRNTRRSESRGNNATEGEPPKWTTIAKTGSLTRPNGIRLPIHQGVKTSVKTQARAIGFIGPLRHIPTMRIMTAAQALHSAKHDRSAQPTVAAADAENDGPKQRAENAAKKPDLRRLERTLRVASLRMPLATGERTTEVATAGTSHRSE